MSVVFQCLAAQAYYCSYCGGEVVFRGNPPKMYHVGTGWDCWRARAA